MLVGRDVDGALEEHVLEQVSEPGSLESLVCRADVIPQIDRDDRRRVILGEHHMQAVREAVALDRNTHGSILVARS